MTEGHVTEEDLRRMAVGAAAERGVVFRRRYVDVEAVQFHLREHADDPLKFDHLPGWLSAAVQCTAIAAVFRSEDYWYLRVKTDDGIVDCSPGDWIVKDENHSMTVLTDSMFLVMYGPVPVLPDLDVEVRINDARVEAIGWTLADDCVDLDEGRDPRKKNPSEMLDRAIKDLVTDRKSDSE